MNRRIRAHIYQHFREHAAVPTVEGIAAALGLSTAVVIGALESLATSRAIVLHPGTHDIWMAHPFSGIPTDYEVSVGTKSWFANCAWDAIAILALLGDGSFSSKDPVNGQPNVWEVANETVMPPGVVHFLVPARQFWDDIGYT